MSWAYTEQIRRRIAAEENTVSLGAGDRLRICLCYPNTYAVGMSSLGFQSLYALLNAVKGVRCERAFLPDEVDIGRGPLLSLETETPVGDFDVIAFSISFDLDVLNVSRMLLLAGVPFFSRERSSRPLVIAGGILPTFNPEPLADFIDAFLIGEAEGALERLATALADIIDGDSLDRLASLAQLPGVYIPSLYHPTYGSDGALADLAPQHGASAEVERLYASPLDAWPCHSQVLTRETEFGGMFLVEVSRGCGRGCKFCVGGHVYRPLRQRPADSVIATALEGLHLRDTIGLIGAAVSDHPEITRICRAILEVGGKISPASVRADSLTRDLLAAIVASGAKTLTLAPESGSEVLRSSVRKSITNEQILRAVQLAAEAGLRRLRLYYMIGLPGETEDEVAAIADLTRAVAAQASHVTVSACAFVPKPQTPFERAGMLPRKVIRCRMDRLRRLLTPEPSTEVSFESPNSSFLQAVISRGDRRLAPVLARLADRSDPGFGEWQNELAAAGIDSDWYACRPRPDTEHLPWAHIGRRCTTVRCE